MATRAEYSSRPNRESLSKRLGKVAKQIKARDGFRCVYCHATQESSGAHLHLDHLIPRSKGGADLASNLVLACRSCNSARHDMDLNVWCASRNLSANAIRAQAAQALV